MNNVGPGRVEPRAVDSGYSVTGGAIRVDRERAETRRFWGGWRALLAAGLVVLLAGCATPGPMAVDRADSKLAGEIPPDAPREFRAVWVATVANIDWPSKPGLPVRKLREEMRAILDRARSLGLNAIILQVRPAADALYPSPYEPWTEFLSGRQGKSPRWFYDPLKEWIREAHVRGLELHAWFNPYRARHPSGKSPLARSHLANTHPEVVKSYGDLLWMDPGEPVARQRTLDVVSDVVRRYDLDGVHIDDYFYPYPVKVPLVPDPEGKPPAPVAGTVEFPDEPAWKRYLESGGTLSRADWRRQSVDTLVEEMHATIHRVKPWVRFGISPFGIGRPDYRPKGIQGFSQYDQLYADVELWLERGWMDYCAPQLYWPIAQKAQAFEVLLDYWIGRNPHGRHLWPGLFTSSVAETPKGWPAEEILRQIDLTRTRPAAGGHVHFSMVALMQDRRGVAKSLKDQTYAQPALVPATPWLGAEAPGAPGIAQRRLTGEAGRRSVTLAPAAGRPTARFAVWKRYGAQWRFSVQPVSEPVVSLAADPVWGAVDVVVVSAVDRLGNESSRVALPLR